MTERAKVARRERKDPTGIHGFDEISRGGLPRGRTTLMIGTPGAGKTVFALQSLVHGAREHGEAGIFVAFEENSAQIVENAASFGWGLAELQTEKLFFLDAYLSPQTAQSGGFDIAGLLAILESKLESLGARRIVFDGIDVLLGLLNDPVAERREVFRLHEWLLQKNLTGIITAKTSFEDPFSTGPWGFMQFMTDCVVLLHHRVVDRVSLRGVRILKYRGSSFVGNEFPLVIGHAGIEVATFGPDELNFAVSSERVSSGVPRLDEMLAGGYFRGSSILITGAPGTSKTTLGGMFTASTCSRGERALYVSFDEPASQIVRNMRSVGIDFAPFLEADELRMYSVRTEVRSAEEHLVVLERMLREFAPSALVVDPVSALLKSGGHVAAGDTAIRLLDLARSLNITALCTSLVPGRGTAEEATELQISTLADTWIHLTYVQQGGERNRALSIVKSRGMAHSNQVRELVLSDDGVTLSDVYVEGGDVLMGTARFEREREARTLERRAQEEAAQRRSELAQQKEEVAARIRILQQQLAAVEAEMSRVSAEDHEWAEQRSTMRDQLRRLRGGGHGAGLVHHGGADGDGAS